MARPTARAAGRQTARRQLRTLQERLRYVRELDERRAAIRESIRAQGKLDEALTAQLMAADSKARLEDIYLPYKPKRRTMAQIAREAGLQPLGELLLADPGLDPQQADVVRVRVVSLDIPRQRISLTMCLDEEPPREGRPGGAARSRDKPPRESQPGRAARSRDKPGHARASREQPAGGAMADALRRAGLAGPAGEDERS